MRTLFVISIVALLALLWASISIARHIRLSRQRKRNLAEQERSADKAPPMLPPGQSAERADWAYFNKDMGDLSDPYETPRNGPKASAER